MSKLIQINAVSNYGSTGKIMESIGLMAKMDGWISKIAVGARYSKPSSLDTYVVANTWQIHVSALYSFMSDRHGFANKFETIHFIKWLEKEKPSVIHLHNIHSYYLNVRLLFEYIASCNTPIVWTLHDCWPITGHCSHFIPVNCYKWENGCSNCPQRHSFPTSIVFDQSQKNFFEKKHLFTTPRNITIVTVSNWLGDVAKHSFLGCYPITVIPNGIDIDVFHPQESFIRNKYCLEDKIVLLGVSTDWRKEKGLDDFIKLRHILSSHYAIVLVGMRPDQIRQYSSTGLICIEKTSSISDLVSWYNTADIVLNLSYAETFGLPVAEGYACGKPALVYDNTALSELIAPGTGVAVKTGSINSVLTAIDSIINSGDVYSPSRCRQRAEDLYDKKNNYRRYLDLYNKVIQ